MAARSFAPAAEPRFAWLWPAIDTRRGRHIYAGSGPKIGRNPRELPRGQLPPKKTSLEKGARQAEKRENATKKWTGKNFLP